MSRQKRSEDDYGLDTGLKLLKVFEALEGTKFEPVTIQRVKDRCGSDFTYAFCRSALLTLKKAGYAAQTPDGWMMGNKVLQLSVRFNDLCIAAMVGERSEISELSEAETRSFPSNL